MTSRTCASWLLPRASRPAAAAFPAPGGWTAARWWMSWRAVELRPVRVAMTPKGAQEIRRIIRPSDRARRAERSTCCDGGFRKTWDRAAHPRQKEICDEINVAEELDG
ncbi:MAG: hypothetical protein LC121_04880 [Anaerolineae bacterium]|nr:hypothetical protein [Anaerolineae bacterium]